MEKSEDDFGLDGHKRKRQENEEKSTESKHSSNDSVFEKFNKDEKEIKRKEQNKENSKRYRDKKKHQLASLYVSSPQNHIQHSQIAGPSAGDVPYVAPRNTSKTQVQFEYGTVQVHEPILSQTQVQINYENEKRKKEKGKERSKRYRDRKRAAAISTITINREEKRKKNKEKCKKYRDNKRATNLNSLQINKKSKSHMQQVSNYQNDICDSKLGGGTSPKDASLVPPRNSTDTSQTQLQREYDASTFLVPILSQSQIQINNDVSQLNDSIVSNSKQNVENIPYHHNLPQDVENNVSMHSQYNVPGQAYSCFLQNSCAHREFQKDFTENDFGHACDICDRLWFKKDLKIVTNDDRTPNIKCIRTMLTNCNVTEVKICSTCLTSIKNNRVPPLSVYNGFKYPPVPKDLKDYPLDLVTERLLSPRIPFMHIQGLRHVYGQSVTNGQVINVPIEVDTMVHKLPRNVDDHHCVTVHIKRKIIKKSSYVYGKIVKGKIKVWLRYLKDTPLYDSYGVMVDDDFLNNQDEDVTICAEDGDNDISEQIAIDDSLIAQQQTLMWNDNMYLRIAPGEENIPNSLLFDEHAEELSFPQIYLGQFRHFREGIMVTPFMMATSELRRSDRRGVTPHHLLYLAMKIMRIRIQDSLSSAFKHAGKGTTVTSEQLQSESDDYIQGCVESDLAFLRTIPNSAYYWSEKKKDVFAMIRQYGKPTVFFTICANEVGWPKLLQLLHNLKHNTKISTKDAADLHFLEKSTLINEDAVTCTIYFSKLVNVIMKVLQSKRYSPFKKYRVLHYFKRIEFQHWGSPCAHILAWLACAPEDALGKDYNKAIDLIDFIISVSASEASGNIQLQTHKHTSMCYKGLASKSVERCRFEAPFMPVKKTMILTPMNGSENEFSVYKAKYNAIRTNLENYEYHDFQTFYSENDISSDQEYVDIIRSGIDRPRVFLKRKPYEKWHNPFNPFIFNVIQSNTDFQFITEEYSCAAYIVEYVNKTNRGVSNLQRKIVEIMDKHLEFDVLEISKNISISLLNHTEMTSQEAAWYLLREPMAKSSCSIACIPTVLPAERQRMKKPLKELSEMEDDCTDVWKENWFDKYEKRPEDLEDISLAQFVSKYYKSYKGKYAKREEPRVIRYRNYDMATDFNEYRREMVTLHLPFRREEADILEEMKFIGLYEENEALILEKKREFESNIDIQKTLQICRELCCKEVSDNDEET